VSTPEESPRHTIYYVDVRLQLILQQDSAEEDGSLKRSVIEKGIMMMEAIDEQVHVGGIYEIGEATFEIHDDECEVRVEGKATVRDE
jgi:hypothetical protein